MNNKFMIFVLMTLTFGLFTACSDGSSGSGGGGGGSAVVTNESLKMIIGRGYDISGRYAYSDDVKGVVLDFDKLYANKMVGRDVNMKSAKFETVSGNNINKYQSSVSASIKVSGKIGFAGASFESEVGTNFQKERTSSDEYSFATSYSKIISDAYRLEHREDPEMLKPYLAPGFLRDLDNLTGSQIIAKYGTDVMLGGIWGARLDYHFSAKKKTGSSSYEIGAFAKAKAEATFEGITAGGGTETELTTKYGSSFEMGSVEWTTQVVGGKPQYAQLVHTKQDYEKWIDSIEGNEVWSDYYPQSLMPIYELIDNATKRVEVKNACDTYLAGKEIKINATTQYGTTDEQFLLMGDAQLTEKKSGGDDDIGSKAGQQTHYTITVVLDRADESSMQATVTYNVKEGKSNWTELEFTQSKKIPVNKNNFTIDETPQAWTGTGTVEGEHHEWIPIYTNCPFMTNVEIKIDGSGNDKSNIGIKGNFIVDYSYR